MVLLRVLQGVWWPERLILSLTDHPAIPLNTLKAGSNPAVPTIKIKQLHESPLGDFFVYGLCDHSGARSVPVCNLLAELSRIYFSKPEPGCRWRVVLSEILPAYVHHQEGKANGALRRGSGNSR